MTFPLPPGPWTGRREDIDAKHLEVAKLLTELDVEGLLVLDPANVAWLSAGAVAHPGTDPSDTPAIYFSHAARWILCSALDTQALFDDQLDGLGFQLKEWSWTRSRGPLLNDAMQDRRVACDRPREGAIVIAETLAKMRRRLTAWEQQRLREVGADLAHALEATGRNAQVGESERQVAGQLAHRLLQRGLTPLAVTVSADQRARLCRRHGCTAVPIQSLMVLEATAAREGLHATASRVVVWGEPDAHFRCEFDAALRLGVAWHAASKADATTVDILTAGVAALPKVSASEVDWLTVPPGWVTGRERTELILSARVAEPLRNDWALSWSARVGPAVCGETMIVTPEGPVCVTPPGPEGWPVRRAKLGGQNYDRPDLLIRSDTA